MKSLFRSIRKSLISDNSTTNKFSQQVVIVAKEIKTNIVDFLNIDNEEEQGKLLDKIRAIMGVTSEPYEM